MSINKLLIAMTLGLALAACSKQEAAQDAAASANQAATEAQAAADQAAAAGAQTADAAQQVTGDDLVLWIVLAVGSVAALTAIIVFDVKRKNGSRG